MPSINFDTLDIYEFEYNGTVITVENSETKATIVLKANGETKAESKGIKAVTGIGALEFKLDSGETVKATIQKIKLGDSECKVTVDGKPLELKRQTHGKKDVAEGAVNTAKGIADSAKNAVKSAVDKVKKN